MGITETCQMQNTNSESVVLANTCGKRFSTQISVTLQFPALASCEANKAHTVDATRHITSQPTCYSKASLLVADHSHLCVLRVRND